jgi:hypothetical protein
MLLLWELDKRLGWLNALTADLSIAQVVQGQGLSGTTPVPGQDQGVQRRRRGSSSP